MSASDPWAGGCEQPSPAHVHTQTQTRVNNMCRVGQNLYIHRIWPCICILGDSPAKNTLAYRPYINVLTNPKCVQWLYECCSSFRLFPHFGMRLTFCADAAHTWKEAFECRSKYGCSTYGYACAQFIWHNTGAARMGYGAQYLQVI
jgi:hypothetical protein